MTDIAGRPWPAASPAFARPASHPLRVLSQLIPQLHTRPRPGFDPARPPLSTSIDRWLDLYLRARL